MEERRLVGLKDASGCGNPYKLQVIYELVLKGSCKHMVRVFTAHCSMSKLGLLVTPVLVNLNFVAQLYIKVLWSSLPFLAEIFWLKYSTCFSEAA